MLPTVDSIVCFLQISNSDMLSTADNIHIPSSDASDMISTTDSIHNYAFFRYHTSDMLSTVDSIHMLSLDIIPVTCYLQ